MTVRELGRSSSREAREESGYVAVMTAILLTVLMGLTAFAVDVGHWYYVGMQEQRAADAAALAGVTSLPGDATTAYGDAVTYAGANGYAASSTVSVVPSRPGATQLKVEISRQVDNIFGGLLGVPKTTVTRSAVAEFAGPVPMGSPCNRYGDDPAPAATSVSANCDNAGAFWANVGSPAAAKSYGDAYQDKSCSSESGCASGVNTDYDPNGYTYLVKVAQPVTNLTIEAFDPAQVVVGDVCEKNNLAGAMTIARSNALVPEPDKTYAPGPTAWCTGDQNFGTGLVKTRFVVRSPGVDQWDPLSWPLAPGCAQTFDPYNGDLKTALDRSSAGYRADVAASFRQWVSLCTVRGVVQPGTYAVQVFTNGLGADAEGGHNRFALRAYGSNPLDADAISIAGSGKMAMYANTPNGTSRFFLARVPSGSGGHILNINLFDIGDGARPGSTVTVIPPSEVGGFFSGCSGSGVTTGALPTCQIPVSSIYNGRWQSIAVPIPASYSCNDSDTAGCWVRLEFYYGAGSQPADTTSWTASLEGDPIRLIE